MPIIWFDFDNSPHVPVLLPIAKEMRYRGYKTFFTARDVAQTVGLLENSEEQHVVIDHAFPKQTIKKYYYTISRARHLKQVIKYVQPVCSVSHCSRSAILGAWMLGIPSMTMYDYEFINTTIQDYFCTKVLIPKAVDKNTIHQAGINHNNLIQFPGLKEHLYLGDFKPDPYFGEKYHIPVNDRIIMTFRPPAENSHYHNNEVEAITTKLLEKVNENKEKLFVVLTPRTTEQRIYFSQFFQSHCIDHHIPDNPLPGADLIFHSDLLITGGGTMVREAAVLGVPAYSIFKGKKGAVDRHLENQQRLFFIETPDQVSTIEFKKHKKISNPTESSADLLHFICDQIENLVTDKSRASIRDKLTSDLLIAKDLH